jgi:hypothetical protein
MEEWEKVDVYVNGVPVTPQSVNFTPAPIPIADTRFQRVLAGDEYAYDAGNMWQAVVDGFEPMNTIVQILDDMNTLGLLDDPKPVEPPNNPTGVIIRQVDWND